MSGTVGRFTLPAGTKVDEAKIREAVESRQLTFGGVEARERAPAVSVWRYQVSDAPT